jgi:Domain of unknown function (DUF4258)
VFEQVLRRIQRLIREQSYVMTIHAEDEMVVDNLTIHDVEHAIPTGEIIERQEDAGTLERRYCIRGRAVDDDDVEVVAKVSPGGGRVVIITLYAD